MIDLLKKLNVIGVSLANNHIYDLGHDGLINTIKQLDGLNILHCGAGANLEDASKPAVVEINGKKYAFLAFILFITLGTTPKDIIAIIKNIILKNGYAEKTGGGAIYNMAELTITDSTLKGNTAQDGYGGAISDYEGELKIFESTLQENTAKYGGAIKNSEGELTVTGSTLIGN